MLCRYKELGESRQWAYCECHLSNPVVERCLWNNGRMLQLEVEAQPVPQEATMSHWKTTRRGKVWNVDSSKRGRGPTRGLSEIEIRESSRLSENEALTGTFEHRQPPQYRPSRIGVGQHEREGTGKGAQRKTDSDSYILEVRDEENDGSGEINHWAVHHLWRRDDLEVLTYNHS